MILLKLPSLNLVVLRLDRSIQLQANRYKEMRKAEDSGYRGQAEVRRD
jgi:hypothetical protein